MTLSERIEELVVFFGGQNQAAYGLEIDVASFSRMRNGKSNKPTKATLQKLGLRKCGEEYEKYGPGVVKTRKPDSEYI